jgi:hypothetical protein
MKIRHDFGDISYIRPSTTIYCIETKSEYLLTERMLKHSEVCMVRSADGRILTPHPQFLPKCGLYDAHIYPRKIRFINEANIFDHGATIRASQ